MRPLFTLLALVLSIEAQALPASEYLPADADLDPAVPAPETVLGWEVGEWRITHDQLVAYLQAVARTSDRVSIEELGRTHEGRPQLLLTITAPQNHAVIESLRERHLARSRGEPVDAPLVVWLGQSIHGNESSGSNAAPLIAYYLAASRSAFVRELLDNSIVLLDSSSNPDGMQRFSTWSNSNRSRNPVADPNHRIHNEDWPQNRTNHYLFDLNRDWLPLVHPESRARAAGIQRWLPHVMTDQHEASSAISYFFQPGAPERQNPLLPEETLAMHRKLARYHAEAMDVAGEPIYSEDVFDDFYVGKGSTYTDINGVIGILFEQPRINGPLREAPFGALEFTDGVANQFRTTVSTLRGAHELRDELANYQAGFFRIMARRAREAGFAAWVIGDDGDPGRARALLEVLDRHDIRYRELGQDLELDGQTFHAGHAWVLPVQQRQYALLRAIMERRTEFRDETFYDVSAWSLPLAYNLPHQQLRRMPETREPSGRNTVGTWSDQPIAWLVPWNQIGGAGLLQHLLNMGAHVQVATTPFSATTPSGEHAFGAGTLQLHLGVQEEGRLDEIRDALKSAAAEGLEVHAATGSMTPEGPDLGHRDFAFLEPIRLLLISGEGTSAYEVGEVWHHLDLRIGLAPVMVDMQRLGRLRLADYTHLIMVDGSYGALRQDDRDRVAAWVKDGGILIATSRAAEWAEKLCFQDDEEDCEEQDSSEEAADVTATRAYADFEDDRVQKIIGGAIVASRLDLTHPLGFGYARDDLPLFRRGTTLLKSAENPYATPVRYTNDPLLSGFIGPERLQEMSGKAAVVAERQGDGLVVRFANNPLFRGFWRGTEKLFENALYFGQVVQGTSLPDE